VCAGTDTERRERPQKAESLRLFRPWVVSAVAGLHRRADSDKTNFRFSFDTPARRLQAAVIFLQLYRLPGPSL
jgi:hypothetical protein